MEYFTIYKGKIIWYLKTSGMYHAMPNMRADTLKGIKKLVRKHLEEER